MRLLVLGGSWFYGRAVVEAATAAGWEITTFRRGRTGQPLDMGSALSEPWESS
ncbi:hypothetical protein LX15_001941 [Streptoalloteichus tenebrarius]|uniref:Uncharacterized protein n=1 Tax=Streptoalloteichus tenebrarius (strain ATCC 17920 / DSM 40477 / JCM 4838 / CBS 697.72 / NBRC 16177 / NCIMB 11028 / NRRL B-12390 / A12253. 1 / ISP 5477) TaxID=1933 RepID=A0ABT1HRX9_STRSD|nr:hypothetical protein [Streptoalloteichus tenebrarius]